jgi:hypothetical protein
MRIWQLPLVKDRTALDKRIPTSMRSTRVQQCGLNWIARVFLLLLLFGE